MKKIFLISVALLSLPHAASAFSWVSSQDVNYCWLETYKVKLPTIRPPVNPEQTVMFCIPDQGSTGAVSEKQARDAADKLADLAENPKPYTKAELDEMHRKMDEQRKKDKAYADDVARNAAFINPDAKQP